MLDASKLGDVSVAAAEEHGAILAASQKLAAIRAEVVRADQDRTTFASLLVHTEKRVAAAEEAVRLAKANLAAGLATFLDVQHDEARAAEARLRRVEAVVGYDKIPIDLLAALGVLNEDLLLAPR